MANTSSAAPPQGALRELPSVDELLRSDECRRLLGSHAQWFVVRAAREAVGEARERVAASGRPEPVASIAATVAQKVEGFLRPSIVRVINATGTVLHTNLGRALLSKEAADAALSAAVNAVNVEYDLPASAGEAESAALGARGSRDGHAARLLTALTGAEGACVVNNNAAAVLITLNTFAEGKEVIISRGELIEIGGSFRLPDIIKKSGCILKEVGTTNRTHPRDYLDAINDRTALILKAHTSNYVVSGFTAEVGLKELVEIGRMKGVPVVEDLGSGSLADLAAYGLPAEPIVGDRVAMGADVVTFSGDKLLGGPQAGLIAGKSAAVERIEKNPLKRALRADKLTLSALEATLGLYFLAPEILKERLPTLRSMTRPIEEIEAAAQRAAELIRRSLGDGFNVTVEGSTSVVGAGSLPGRDLPTRVVAVTHSTMGPNRVARLFIDNDPPIVGRIANGSFLLDMRTVERAEDVVPSARKLDKGVGKARKETAE